MNLNFYLLLVILVIDYIQIKDTLTDLTKSTF